ncbi:hypothetical protein BS78_04G158900 [Paspalum vaginatum]|nr:hypothetical protein BS78_04G158900 [Paspalum vaginatum]
MAEEEPQPGPWYILHRAAHVRHDAATSVDNPEKLLSFDLPLDDEPLSISRLTAHTRREAEAVPPPSSSQAQSHPSDDHLVIVANDKEDLLLHVSGSPYGFNLDPSGRRGTFFVARQHNFWAVPAAASPDGRNAFQVTAARQPNRERELPSFSGFNNVGLLRLRDRGGSFVIAELQANERRHDDLTVPLITFRCDKEKTGWDETHPHWGVVDDEASPHWTTHGVVAHDDKLWWVNLSRGLVVCNPVPSQDLEPRLEFVPFPAVLPDLLDNKHDRPPESIERYRIVKASAGKIRFVDVARNRADPGREEETRVVVWTLADMPPIGIPQWENHPCQTTLAKIWANARYVEKGMPREVPFLALVHPTEPAVVYFFLNQHIFSVNVKKSTVVDYALMSSVPRPINQHDVLAWVRPCTKFKTRSLNAIDDRRYPVIPKETDTDSSQDSKDVAPAEEPDSDSS